MTEELLDCYSFFEEADPSCKTCKDRTNCIEHTIPKPEVKNMQTKEQADKVENIIEELHRLKATEYRMIRELEEYCTKEEIRDITNNLNDMAGLM